MLLVKFQGRRNFSSLQSSVFWNCDELTVAIEPFLPYNIAKTDLNDIRFSQKLNYVEFDKVFKSAKHVLVHPQMAFLGSL